MTTLQGVEDLKEGPELRDRDSLQENWSTGFRGDVEVFISLEVHFVTGLRA